MGVRALASRRGRFVVLGAAIVCALGALALVVRARRRAWWIRVDDICDCGSAARRELGILSRQGGGGLPEVARAELRTVENDCEDLRVAMGHRAWMDELRQRALRVAITDAHRREIHALGAALEAMCGEARRAYWEALRAQVAADLPDDAPLRARAALQGAHQYLRIRDGMCARREVLAAQPRAYELTPARAAQLARACGR